jgi:hypothetical protein
MYGRGWRGLALYINCKGSSNANPITEAKRRLIVRARSFPSRRHSISQQLAICMLAELIVRTMMFNLLFVSGYTCVLTAAVIGLTTHDVVRVVKASRSFSNASMQNMFWRKARNANAE